MKFCFVLMTIVIGASATAVQAQDKSVKQLQADASREIKADPKDTTQKTWKVGGNFATNINQGSLSNWSAGGDKFSFSLNSYLSTFAFYKKKKNSWNNTLDLAYGIVNTTSLGHRKASDRIDLLSKYGYQISDKTDVGILGNFRSQFANGYGYVKTASGKDSSYITSRSLQPAYILVSPGFNFRPAKTLSIFLSPATARWVVVSDAFLKPVYGVPVNKNSKQEFGAFSTINFQSTFAKNLGFKSKLDLFSNYKHDPQNIDVFWSNALTAKITRYINFSLNVDLIYDNDTKNVEPGKGPAPQILQLMGIGFAYSFKK